MNEQFDLIYHGRFNYTDTELMPSFERKYFYSRLREQKDEEKKEMDKISKVPHK